MGVVGALTSVASLGYSVYSGEQARSAGKKNLALQQQAQRQAQSSALAQEQRAAQDLARANRRKPDVGALLNDAQAGPGTLLTGGLGIDPFLLKLGRKTLLGTGQ